MSKFFAQLGSNISLPNANINGSGPLPTSLSGPAGINGDPDNRINFNSELLAHAYGPGKGRMGRDRNYQQIPHRIQKIIPKLFLPYADIGNAHAVVALSHSVDQGYVAFILQSSRVQGQLFDSTASSSRGCPRSTTRSTTTTRALCARALSCPEGAGSSCPTSSP